MKKFSDFFLDKDIKMIKNGKINENIKFIKPVEIGLDLVNHKSGYVIDMRKYI